MHRIKQLIYCPMTRHRSIHTVCHAHLDPVWLWTWQEGLIEAISTFRVAVDFCKKYPSFKFCQGDALLYQWVESNDPTLFTEIKKLVKTGRWHIMSGSYLQPDLNLPSGESHIRQFLYAITYFVRNFGVRPETAWNIDSFGQAEGLPQILSGCGIKYYIFSRPRPASWKLPEGVFRWRDRSGNEVLALRYRGSYNTRKDVRRQLESLIADSDKNTDLIFLWGLGDHGGGPSHEQFRVLESLRRRFPALKYSTPSAFFRPFSQYKDILPIVTGEFQNASPGCYTSMARIKSAHRKAENLITAVERLASFAWWLKQYEYPKKDLDWAWRQILFTEFHDVITGTCIQPAENDTLNMLFACHDLLKRLQTKLLLKFARHVSSEDKYTCPIFVFNPHSFNTDIDLEFSFNHSVTPDPPNTIHFAVYMNGKRISSQRERGPLNVEHDWNLYGCCHVKLPPLSLVKLDVKWKRLSSPPRIQTRHITTSKLRLRSKYLKIVINPRTGLLDWAGTATSGSSYLKASALQPVVFRDISHSWWCGTPSFSAGASGKPVSEWGKPCGYFKLATPRLCASICSPRGGRARIPPVRIVEDGDVRVIVEAIFVYSKSWIIRWYIFSKHCNFLEIRDRVFWNERSLMLKLQVPFNFIAGSTLSETPYSAIERPASNYGREQSNQKWVKVIEKHGSRWVGVANSCSYAHHTDNSAVYFNMLRSPLYGTSWMAAEIPEREDRYLSRQDNGEHEFRFAFVFGEGKSNLPLIHCAELLNVPPLWLNCRLSSLNSNCYQASPIINSSLLQIAPPSVELVALKQSEDGKSLIIRLMEHEGQKTYCRISFYEGEVVVPVEPYQLKTISVQRTKHGLKFTETNLVEEQNNIK
jgi:alpha-mannosidase